MPQRVPSAVMSSSLQLIIGLKRKEAKKETKEDLNSEITA